MNKSLVKEFASTYYQVKKPKVNFRIQDLKSYYHYRPYLPHYQFNDQLSQDLIVLLLNYLDNEKRLDRHRLFSNILSQLISIKREQRFKGDRPTEYNISPISKPTKDKFFELFQRIITDKWNLFYKKNKTSSYWLLMDLVKRINWDESQWNWVLEHVKTIPHIRPLLEDTIITVPNIESFVLKHYNDTFIVENRTKYIAHILDNNPDFVIEKETILNDCAILNTLDQEYITQIIDKFEQDQLLTEVNWQLEFGQHEKFKEMDKLTEDYSNEKMGSSNHDDDSEDWEYPIRYSENTMNHIKNDFIGYHHQYCFLPHHRRLYPVPNSEIKKGKVIFPDFDLALKLLNMTIDKYQAKYMVWSIVYSRLPKRKKIAMIRKWWREDLAYTWLFIAKRHNLPEILIGHF